ncbi:glycogen/starch/alpha-glucan phosphorylase [Brucepastera parasyntrophica]|uniref:glycogen/starch/alpha-glucan phosphorylase n=1 Tax=Brucepastera parasyntrophica TaxID=2880008 RepID=UPI00210DECB4|nr:glycogen/starch/alpha-glucan phosphorylase [Brucepastera parasyntrophica]ULQ61066.1 glycogen/starch/alpha-glucan phosphorylase [Brucepastera parasyntrophica]
MKLNKEEFKEAIRARLKRHYGKDLEEANKHDIYDAVSTVVMDHVQTNWMATRKMYGKNQVKQMYYMSAEFLMGRAMSNNLVNFGIKEGVTEVLKELNFDYTSIEDEEPDAGLGNGGLGRLAACFLDSLATLDYPGHGYGIRYQYGMFEQHIENGYQVEYPDNWLKHRDPWEIKRSDLAVKVLFGGTAVAETGEDGNLRYKVIGAEEITAVPYDVPVVGFDTPSVNRLRLWEAISENGFDLQLFNDMQYMRAVERQNNAENISRVLYPNDSGPSGKTLRLKQQYFFTSASLQDLVAKFKRDHGTDFSKFPDYNVIQLNDTHPVVAIPEMMRLLMDENDMGWEEAWDVVTRTFAYTNHTILAEALEKWPIDIFEGLLPRIYQIVEEINRRFMTELREKFPGNWEKQNRMSIIGDGMIRMAWLAIVACFSVNGVAALHTEILKTVELVDWVEIYPEKFNNKTNGVTQRRWLLCANPKLAEFITNKIGPGWEKDLVQLRKLEKFADDPKVLDEFMEIKHQNKVALAAYLKETQNVIIDPDSIFDVQIKRLHEYKRQLMNILHIMYMYNRILEDPSYDPVPRTFIFGAKAASGYRRAKSIIKLINTVADRVNNDHRVKDRIKIVFAENYRVSLAEKLFPASDVSEQISTAGKEASGTGNMKFMMNGAVTIGTMDGANVEIVEEVGAENAFIFGLTADEIQKIDAAHSYNPQEYLEKNPKLAAVLNQLVDGTYNSGALSLFRELYDSLVFGVEGQRPDVYYILADFDSYVEAQEKLAKAYSDKRAWAKMAFLNVAASGKFSSDRTIEDYVSGIWHLKKIVVEP